MEQKRPSHRLRIGKASRFARADVARDRCFIRSDIHHASELISSVDSAWIDSVAHPSTTNDDSSYARGEALMSDEDFNALKTRFEQFCQGFRMFDQRFTVACLHLPAAQHIAVPAKPSTGITLYESSLPIVKHAFNSKTWNELCHVEKSDVSIFGPYWLRPSPLHKHELVDTICSEFIKLGFQEMSSISMTKPFIHEALGANINESRHVLTTLTGSNEPRSRSLITSGLGSLASILVPFVRRTFLQPDLPFYVFTQGTTYDANQPQSHKIQLLAMTHVHDTHLKNIQDPLLDESINELQPSMPNESIEREHEYNLQIQHYLRDKKAYEFRHTSSLNEIFLELARLMFNLYEKFRLPFRIRNCSSDQLRAYESMRLDYELFLPSANAYVCVGSVSLVGDYLSRRLMIRHKKVRNEQKSSSTTSATSPADDLPRETKFNYAEMVHVQVVDIDLITKCYVEKEQRSFSKASFR